jgi:SAM-dependent methyltransferase
MDMESLYQPFLELIPACGRILDAGCGSGRDTKAFLERGYDVTAIDASSKMVESAAQLTGVTVEQVCFQELEYEAEFHGVWACASLLHVPRSELDDVLERIQLALRPGGVCFMSFKLGEEERLHGDRRFTDFTAQSLDSCLAGHLDFHVIRVWISDDVRPERNDQWVNALVGKRSY